MDKKKEEKAKPEKKESKLVLVKASEHLLNSRYITLPPTLLNKQEYKQLKAGEGIAIEEDKFQFHKSYFVEVNE